VHEPPCEALGDRRDLLGAEDLGEDLSEGVHRREAEGRSRSASVGASRPSLRAMAEAITPSVRRQAADSSGRASS